MLLQVFVSHTVLLAVSGLITVSAVRAGNLGYGRVYTALATVEVAHSHRQQQAFLAHGEEKKQDTAGASACCSCRSACRSNGRGQLAD